MHFSWFLSTRRPKAGGKSSTFRRLKIKSDVSSLVVVGKRRCDRRVPFLTAGHRSLAPTHLKSELMAYAGRCVLMHEGRASRPPYKYGCLRLTLLKSVTLQQCILIASHASRKEFDRADRNCNSYCSDYDIVRRNCRAAGFGGHPRTRLSRPQAISGRLVRFDDFDAFLLRRFP